MENWEQTDLSRPEIVIVEDRGSEHAGIARKTVVAKEYTRNSRVGAKTHDKRIEEMLTD